VRTVHFEVNIPHHSYLKRLVPGLTTSDILSIKNAGKYNEAQVVTVRSHSKINDGVLNKLPNLKLICTRTGGYDHIVLDSCKKRGIAVYRVPDYGAYAIAEHVFAMLLSMTRRVVASQKEIREGKFSYEKCEGYTLNGKTLGVVGTGKIGLEVARLGKAFGMKLAAFDVLKNDSAALEIGFNYLTLEDLIKTSDVITLHVPLLPQTKHLINTKTIKQMKKGVIFVNASRGAVVNTSELVKHIKKFKYVCLDVLEDEEGFSKDNPLLKYDNVLITPHCAFFTDRTIEASSKITYDNIQAFLGGSDVNRLT